MISWLKRWAIEAEDCLRYSPLVKGILRRYRLLCDRVPDGSDPQAVARSLARLCATARLAIDDNALLAVEERIRQRVKLLDGRRIDWREFAPGIDDRRIAKAAILKPPVGPREKGVLFISFEEEWTRLIHHCDLRALAECYLLVISPTWSPPHCLATTAFARAWPGPLFSLISNTRDLEILPRLAPNYIPVPLFASSWVNPAFYRPLPRVRRDVDIVMLANFGKYKRHLALFRALRGISPRPRVLLLGQEQGGRTAATLRAEAGAYGVADALTIRTNVSDAEVADSLARARVSLILSRREGSCVAVAESLFADTPVGLLQNAEVGSRAFLNAQTGRFLDERHLASELTAFLAEAERYAPRAWADEHLSCFRSSAALNDVLKKHARAAGEEWTCDLAPLCWRPNPVLVSPEDQERMAAAHEDARRRFDIEIGPPPAVRQPALAQTGP
jgi:glycosyltransferase involved in cell wall biosynthesis